MEERRAEPVESLLVYCYNAARFPMLFFNTHNISHMSRCKCLAAGQGFLNAHRTMSNDVRGFGAWLTTSFFFFLAAKCHVRHLFIIIIIKYLFVSFFSCISPNMETSQSPLYIRRSNRVEVVCRTGGIRSMNSDERDT